MVDRFRASGLSHLTAVSGQNVAFLLAAAGPLLPPPAAVAALGRHAGVDRLVRGAHTVRAVDRPGRGDGGAVGDRVRRSATNGNRCACCGWR